MFQHFLPDQTEVEKISNDLTKLFTVVDMILVFVSLAVLGIGVYDPSVFTGDGSAQAVIRFVALACFASLILIGNMIGWVGHQLYENLKPKG